VQLARFLHPHGNLHADSVARYRITCDSTDSRTFRTGAQAQSISLPISDRILGHGWMDLLSRMRNNSRKTPAPKRWGSCSW
jgi:hypothetical protein